MKDLKHTEKYMQERVNSMGIIMGLALYLISKIDIGGQFNSLLIVILGYAVGIIYIYFKYDLDDLDLD